MSTPKYEKVPLRTWAKDDQGIETSRVTGYFFRFIGQPDALEPSFNMDAIAEVLSRPSAPGSDNGGSKVRGVSRSPRPILPNGTAKPLPAILRP